MFQLLSVELPTSCREVYCFDGLQDRLTEIRPAPISDPRSVWKVIESMSSEDQSGFVRFAWGRSRLPPKAFWRVNMKLLRSNMGEESLPVRHAPDTNISSV